MFWRHIINVLCQMILPCMHLRRAPGQGMKGHVRPFTQSPQSGSGVWTCLALARIESHYFVNKMFQTPIFSKI